MSYPVPEITNPIQYYYEQTKYINLNNDSSLFLLPMADFRDFVGAVTWTEGFLVTLMSFQILFLVLVIATRKSQTFQMFLMFAITGLVTSSRKLNSLGQEHWRKFASQNYFDRQGLFMLIFYSGPLMLSATFIMVCI